MAWELEPLNIQKSNFKEKNGEPLPTLRTKQRDDSQAKPSPLMSIMQAAF
jgi:hypothetical protein